RYDLLREEITEESFFIVYLFLEVFHIERRRDDLGECYPSIPVEEQQVHLCEILSVAPDVDVSVSRVEQSVLAHLYSSMSSCIGALPDDPCQKILVHRDSEHHLVDDGFEPP